MKSVEELAREISRISPAELEIHGVLKRAVKSGYVCPDCNNGEGEDGTGIDLNNMGSHYAAHCFKCGGNFNNFHFLADYYHLDRKGDFVEIVKRAAEEFHLENSVPKTILPIEKNSTEEVGLIHSDISTAEKTLNNFLENNDGKVRGLNPKILQKFHCGYLQNWIHPKNRFGNKKVATSRRLIIPTANHYNAVLVQADRTEQNKKWWKMHAGTKEVFGLNLVPDDAEFLIVVEGETDAMSIVQATDEKVFVIAIGGAAETKFVEELNQKFPTHKPNILVLFDPDEAGRKNAPKVCKLLEKNNFPTTFKFLSNEICKLDANQILQERGDAKLGEIISLIINDAQKDFEKIPVEKTVPDTAPSPKPNTTKAIIPNCPVDYFLPYNFGFDEKGITKFSKSKGFVTVSHTPVVVTRRFIDPDTKQYKYELAFLNHTGNWSFITVDSEVIADNKKIVQLAKYGVSVTSSGAKDLTKFLDDFIYAGDNAQKMKTLDSYSQPGWTEDLSKFIYPTGGDDYICHRNGYDYDKLFKTKGDKNKWKNKFCEVKEQGGAIGRAVFGTAMAASVVEHFDIANIQVHLEGKRGIGKTALPKFALSVFGDPRQGRLSRTFKATAKNNLETAAAFCGFPVVLDELETLDKRDEDKLPSMIYDYSLGVGNQANKRDGTARKPIEFSGCRISTGERPILKSNDKAGAFKRVVNLRAKGSLFEDKFASELHTFSAENCGLYGKEWIDYVVKNISAIKDEYNEIFDNFQNDVTETTQLKSVILMFVAYKHFCKCIGVEYSDENMLSDIIDIFTDLPSKKEIDDTHRAKELLASFVAGHKKYFVTESKNSTDFPETDAVAFETYGKIFDNGEVAFLPHKLKQILENDLNFASADKLISEWADEGKLRCQDDRRNTYRTRINGKSQWTYRFKAGVLINQDSTSEEENA